MSKRQRKQTESQDDLDIEAWVTKLPTVDGCRTCGHDGASSTTRRLLEAMSRNPGHSVTLRLLHAKVRELNESYRVGFWGFRDHLYTCERDLYKRAKRG